MTVSYLTMSDDHDFMNMLWQYGYLNNLEYILATQNEKVVKTTLWGLSNFVAI